MTSRRRGRHVDVPDISPDLKSFFLRGVRMECPPDTIVNFKTLGCVKDTTNNRRRLGYPQKPCPPDKPLRNPETLRCLKDTPKNRKALGLPQLKEPAKKTRRSKPTAKPAPGVRRQSNVRTSAAPENKPRNSATDAAPERKQRKSKPTGEPRAKAASKKQCPPDKPLRNPETMRCLKDTPTNRNALEPAKKTRRSKATADPAPKVRRQPNIRTSTAPETKPQKPVIDAASELEQRESEPADEARAKAAPKRRQPTPEPVTEPDAIPAYFPRSQVEIDNDLPPVRRVFMDVEPYRKPVPTTKAKKTPLASHLHKLAYGDYLDEHQIDFLDKMSLVNERKARWKGKVWQSAVGLLYVAMRHRETACVGLTDPQFLSFEGFRWRVYESFDSEPLVKVEIDPVPYRKVVKFRKLGFRKRRVLQLTHPYLDLKLAYDRCKTNNKRFMVGTISLTLHLNAFVYDMQLQTLEIFEPHGAGSAALADEYPDEMYTAIYTVMRRYVPIKKLIRPDDYCPRGPQVLDANMSSMFNAMLIKDKPIGYCGAWSLYYLDLRLSNPDIPQETLISSFNARFWYNSLTFINAYSNFIIKMYDDLIASPEFRDATLKQQDRAIRERMMQVMRNIYGN